jgi:hypothetical protein
MAHQRKLIRDAAVGKLLAQTDAGSKVYANRIKPFTSNGWTSELPAIVVYTMDEQAEIFNAAPREYLRTVQLVVEIQAAADESLDDVLDNIADQVERAMLRDDTLAGTVNNLLLVRSRMALRDEGETLIGACIVQFDAQYLDRRPDDLFNATLPELTTVDTQYSLNNAQPDPADRARTLIELIEESIE